jgi:hypothetical protein
VKIKYCKNNSSNMEDNRKNLAPPKITTYIKYFLPLKHCISAGLIHFLPAITIPHPSYKATPIVSCLLIRPGFRCNEIIKNE